MNILDCTHPKRIFNQYSQEWQYVPCGKCATCLQHKSSQWIQRLNVERKCWKYCLFFTLTYSEDYCPYIENLDNNYYIDLTHLHQREKENCVCINLHEVFDKCSPEQKETLSSFISKNNRLSYLSVYDAQCFIKRLRKNLKTYITNSFKQYDEKDYFIRYYLIGEYGSTTLRAHYHGLLFFSSEKEASCIEEILRKSWKFGLVDTSYVADSNSAYLAKYLNCTASMPKIYEHKNIKPFAIYSKQPPIGTLYNNEKKVREIFDSASPRMFVDYLKTLSIDDVPLWRTYQDRLFPKLSGFSRFSHFDRIKLYRASFYFKQAFGEVTGADFAAYMIGHYDNGNGMFCQQYLHVYHDYINMFLEHDCDLRNCLIRWFNLSSHVEAQSAVFNISIEKYVCQIEKYYNNYDFNKLKVQYEFMEEYSEQYGSESLIGIDKLFLESILDVPLDLMSYEEITILKSYGINVEKFTSLDLSEKLEYQYTILPENTRDYANVVKESEIWLKKSLKTKVKNDYLASHPELQYKMSDYITMLNQTNI